MNNRLHLSPRIQPDPLRIETSQVLNPIWDPIIYAQEFFPNCIIQGLSLWTATQVEFTYVHILEIVLLESFKALSCYENFFLPTKSCI